MSKFILIFAFVLCALSQSADQEFLFSIPSGQGTSASLYQCNPGSNYVKWNLGNNGYYTLTYNVSMSASCASESSDNIVNGTCSPFPSDDSSSVFGWAINCTWIFNDESRHFTGLWGLDTIENNEDDGCCYPPTIGFVYDFNSDPGYLSLGIELPNDPSCDFIANEVNNGVQASYSNANQAILFSFGNCSTYYAYLW